MAEIIIWFVVIVALVIQHIYVVYSEIGVFISQPDVHQITNLTLFTEKFINLNSNRTSNFTLQPIPISSETVINTTCSVLANGSTSIVVGPSNPHQLEISHFILASAGIPQIAPIGNEYAARSQSRSPLLVRLSPSSHLLSTVATMFIKRQGWDNVGIIGSTSQFGVSCTTSLTQILSVKSVYSNVYVIETVLVMQLRKQLHEMSSQGIRVVLVCLEPKLLTPVLRSAKYLNLLTGGYSWIIIDFDDENYANNNSMNNDLNGFISITPELLRHSIGVKLSQQWLHDEYYNSHGLPLTINQQKFAEAFLLTLRMETVLRLQNTKFKMLNSIRCNALLPKNLTTRRLEESKKLQSSLLTFDNILNGPGFSKSLTPTNLHINVMNAQNNEWKMLATWNSYNEEYMLSGVETIFSGGQSFVSDRGNTLKGRHLTVFLSTQVPFVFWTEPTGPPNPEYIQPNVDVKGVAVDLWQRLSTDLGFTYSFTTPKVKGWGGRIPGTTRYSGMLGELQAKRADALVSNIFVTEERSQDFDYTAPWWKGGASFILHQSNEHNLFLFLTPLATEVWVMSLAVMLGSGFLIAVLNKLSPYEYHGQWVLNTYHNLDRVVAHRRYYVPFRRQLKRVLNEFNLPNAIFFTMASLLRQGYHTYPQSSSARVVTCCWWCVVLIIINSYTAKLTARFTAEKLVGTVDTFSELVADNRYLYGTGGSLVFDIINNTQVDTYIKMKTVIKSKDLFYSTQKGVDKVRSDHFFAYIWERNVLNTIVNEQPCNLRVSSESLGQIMYSFLLPKGSPYTRTLSEGILQLQQAGFVEKLMEKWRSKLSKCEWYSNAFSRSVSEGLRVSDFKGMFMVILLSFPIGVLILIIEWFWSFKRLSPKLRRSPLTAHMHRFTRLKRDIIFNYVPTNMKKRFLMHSELVTQLIKLRKGSEGALNTKFQIIKSSIKHLGMNKTGSSSRTGSAARIWSLDDDITSAETDGAKSPGDSFGVSSGSSSLTTSPPPTSDRQESLKTIQTLVSAVPNEDETDNAIELAEIFQTKIDQNKKNRTGRGLYANFASTDME